MGEKEGKKEEQARARVLNPWPVAKIWPTEPWASTACWVVRTDELEFIWPIDRKGQAPLV